MTASLIRGDATSITRADGTTADTGSPTRPHGTHVKYVQDRCRCEPCRRATADYERARVNRIEPAYVGASRARDHVNDLTAQSVGLKTIASLAGVSHGALSKLIYGDSARGTPPSRRIRRDTEQAILAVTIATVIDRGPDRAKIPASIVWGWLDEMIGAGIPKSRIATAIGQRGPGLQVGRQVVSVANARKIRDLHRTWKAGQLDLSDGRSIETNHQIAEATLACPTCGTRAVHDGGLDLHMRRAHGQTITTDDEGNETIRVVDLPTFGDEGDTDWMARGACRFPTTPTHLFFPYRGDEQTVAAAKAVCATCPVAAGCLDYALRTHQPGIWGGTSGQERKDIRRARKAAA